MQKIFWSIISSVESLSCYHDWPAETKIDLPGVGVSAGPVGCWGRRVALRALPGCSDPDLRRNRGWDHHGQGRGVEPLDHREQDGTAVK